VRELSNVARESRPGVRRKEEVGLNRAEEDGRQMT